MGSGRTHSSRTSAAGAEKFDYLILGGGSGGIASATAAASLGKRCALIEAARIGGTCVHRGCVPKKLCWYAADALEELHRLAPHYGIAVGEISFNWTQLQAHFTRYVLGAEHAYLNRLKQLGVTQVMGYGRLVDDHTVSVNGRLLQADHILLATGGRPRIPAVPGATLGVTSDEFFGLPEQPKRAVIVGGGYIAVELSTILNALGCDVTLIYRQPILLAAFDHELTSTLAEYLAQSGICLKSSCEVGAITKQKKGKCTVICQSGESIAEVDLVLWATGRIPSTERLGLEDLSIKCDPQGHISVNSDYQTSIQHIYAIGDLIAGMHLTPVAIAAGRRVARKIAGVEEEECVSNKAVVPSVVFSHPPIGMIGLTENAAVKEFGTEAIEVYTRRFVPMHYANTSAEKKSCLKLVCLKADGRVLGLHGIGPGLDELIQGFSVAINQGLTKDALDRSIALHPTLAEEFLGMTLST